MNDFFREFGRVCLGSLAGAGLGAALFVAVEANAYEELYRDPYDSSYGSSSYNDGRYEGQPQFGSGPFGGGTIQDTKTGEYYDLSLIHI